MKRVNVDLPRVRPNLIDRVVGAVSPKAGMQRLAWRSMFSAAGGEAGGYKAGKRDRRGLRFWKPGAGSADADILPDLPDLRARSRDAARNVPIATGVVATNVTSVIGAGLQLNAAIDARLLGISEAAAAAMKTEQEREWSLFCASADLSRVQCFDEMQALVYRATLDSGDVFVVRRYRKDVGDAYGTKLQILEADRVSNPSNAADSATIVAGVEIDSDGVPVAFHVTDRHPGQAPRGAAALKWQRVRARLDDGRQVVLHLFGRDRPEQTRGVPYLAPVLEDLKKLGDYKDNELTAADISSRYTAFVKSTAPDATTALGEVPASGSGSDASIELELAAGAVLGLEPGEDVIFANPQRPNAQFDPFVQALCRWIGVALETPFEILIKHFTASYTASRAAVELFFQYVICRRQGAPRVLCQTAYEWMMEEAVASGRLNRPGFFDDPLIRAAYCGARWIGPPRISLDQLKDANADEKDIATGVKTREEVCLARTGGDWESKTRQLAREDAARKASGLVAPAPVDAGAAGARDDVDEVDDTSDDETQPRPGKGDQ